MLPHYFALDVISKYVQTSNVFSDGHWAMPLLVDQFCTWYCHFWLIFIDKIIGQNDIMCFSKDASSLNTAAACLGVLECHCHVTNAKKVGNNSFWMAENVYIKRGLPLAFIMHCPCVVYYWQNLDVCDYASTDHHPEMNRSCGDALDKSCPPSTQF